jgi:hypothetical protein
VAAFVGVVFVKYEYLLVGMFVGASVSVGVRKVGEHVEVHSVSASVSVSVRESVRAM